MREFAMCVYWSKNIEAEEYMYKGSKAGTILFFGSWSRVGKFDGEMEGDKVRPVKEENLKWHYQTRTTASFSSIFPTVPHLTGYVAETSELKQ